MADWSDFDPMPTPKELRQERVKQFYTKKDQLEREIKRKEATALKAYIERGRKIRPAKPTPSELRKIIAAKRGFHGTVKQPTFFLTGEAGPERVNITPMHKNHHTNNGLKIDLGEPKGYYHGTKEKKRTGFGQIDYDFGLRL